MKIDKCNRILKYILMSLFTFALLKYIPLIMLSFNEMIIISCLVSIFYAILDRIFPSVVVKND